MGRTATIAGRLYTLYDAEYVKECLEDAATTLKRMPHPQHGRPLGYRVAWPQPSLDFWELWNSLDTTERQERADQFNFVTISASNKQIARLDMVLDWLWLVDKDKRKILMARAAGISWRKIAKGTKYCHTWLRDRVYPTALQELVNALNSRT